MTYKRFCGTGIVLLALAAIAYAADEKLDAKADAKADAKIDTSKTRVIKPFSELKDLSAGQVEKLKVIHRKHLDAVKALVAKEHEDLMDVLSADQKKELEELEAKDKADKKKAKMKEAEKAAAADKKGTAVGKDAVKQEE